MHNASTVSIGYNPACSYKQMSDSENDAVRDSASNIVVTGAQGI